MEPVRKFCRVHVDGGNVRGGGGGSPRYPKNHEREWVGRCWKIKVILNDCSGLKLANHTSVGP